jgi:hypothetical protein
MPGECALITSHAVWGGAERPPIDIRKHGGAMGTRLSTQVGRSPCAEFYGAGPVQLGGRNPAEHLAPRPAATRGQRPLRGFICWSVALGLGNASFLQIAHIDHQDCSTIFVSIKPAYTIAQLEISSFRFQGKLQCLIGTEMLLD